MDSEFVRLVRHIIACPSRVRKAMVSGLDRSIKDDVGRFLFAHIAIYLWFVATCTVV